MSDENCVKEFILCKKYCENKILQYLCVIVCVHIFLHYLQVKINFIQLYGVFHVELYMSRFCLAQICFSLSCRRCMYLLYVKIELYYVY